MSTPAESNHEAPLTAADLDRLAHEWSERRVVFNGVEFRAKQDAARTERLVAALPSLLALARRGLEAEASVAHAIGCDVDTRRDRDEWRQIAEKAEFHAVGLNNTRMDLESKLTAALAEVERLRGLLSECRPYVESAAAEQMGYGHFPGGDPRKFTPDEDGTLPEERKAWEEACAKGEDTAPAGQFLPLGDGRSAHVVWQRFGLGTYTYRDEEAAALLARLPAAEAQAAQDGAGRKGGEA